MADLHEREECAIAVIEAERAQEWRKRREAEGQRDVAKAAAAQLRDDLTASEEANARLTEKLADAHDGQAYAEKAAAEMAIALYDTQARVAALEEALEPFAEVAELDVGESESDNDIFRQMDAKYCQAPQITVGDLRRTRALLRPAKEGVAHD